MKAKADAIDVVTTPNGRDAFGRLLPGSALNPAGRPQNEAARLVREACELTGGAAVARLKELMQQSDDLATARAAATTLLSYAIGTAPKAPEDRDSRDQWYGLLERLLDRR